MLSKAKQLLIDIQAIRKAIKNEPGKRISKQALRTQAESLSQRWFSDFAHSLINEAQISKEIINPYNANFDKLLKLSTPNNLKSSYLSVLDSITKSFRGILYFIYRNNPRRQLLH
jgi:hypothetical protein